MTSPIRSLFPLPGRVLRVRALYPALDSVLGSLTGGRLYAAYQLPQEDIVRSGMKHDPRPAIEAAQYTECSVLSARKEHPHGDVYDVGSYRRVASMHPIGVSEGKAIREWEPWECQYHVHVWYFPDSGVWDVASHYELRSSLTKPSIDIERLRTHYKPEWGEEKLLGVLDDRLDNFLP